MSTIASPRPSSSIRSPSSTRTSLDTSTRPPGSTRRNRAALRDYYGLKAAKQDGQRISEESTRTELGPEVEEETLTELDKEGFDAEAYVNSVLATSGLSEVLRVEASLVSQIRNLDSDRKSLVYDNYSKLLAATSTIRRMRTNMDPMTPATHTLSPAISHIAETAAALSSSKHAASTGQKGVAIRVEGAEDGSTEGERKAKERETVRWVLDTPRRLTALNAEGKEKEAEKEWAEISKILDKWNKVPGVKELRATCEDIMRDGEESGAD
ncbi:hypothetical protein M011DRAFT_497790 [Sporormia fimetaria CBS 119925]|uniref:Vacuolar protein sorting-associated protein 51 homolog n=1 Tax=Sporormia fimetaria CBS 119925 TaxID=1340428 RepID=A0A6A6UXY6_9PLEO|nr:hypothetical protein M011DRAFT_497790 [Sporormia fimetaria CBS 119925]